MPIESNSPHSAPKSTWPLFRHWKQSPSFRAQTKIGLISGVIFFIAGLFASPVVTPFVAHIFEVEKQIVITIARSYLIDDYEKYPTYEHVFFVTGCGTRNLVFMRNGEYPEQLQQQVLFLGTTKICPNCTQFNTAFYNVGKPFKNNLFFRFKSSSKFEFDEGSPEVTIRQNVDAIQPNFIIEILGGIKPVTDLIHFSGHITRVGSINTTCNDVEKDNCIFVKYDVAVLKNQSRIDKFFAENMIKEPLYDPHGMLEYQLNEHNEFKLGNASFFTELCKPSEKLDLQSKQIS